jgi:hypothetical protein
MSPPKRNVASMSRTNHFPALLILALALALPAAAPAASEKWDDRCCRMSWALDLSGRRDYAPGIAHLGGEIKTAGKPYGWYLVDERGNAVAKKRWVCHGNDLEVGAIDFYAYLDTRRFKRGGLYYWIIESKRGRTSHRYAHPFRMPTRPISVYAAGKAFASRLRTRELPWGQPVKDAIAGKPWRGGARKPPPGGASKPPPGGASKPPAGGALKPPSNFAARYDASGDGTPLLVTFRNTTSSLLGSVRVYWNLGSCPKISAVADLGGAHVIQPATPGQDVRIDDRLPSVVPGGSRRICVAAWSLGKNNSVSAAVTATVELPA